MVLLCPATIKSNGIQNILALCGDPPHGQDKFVQVDGGFACALDLIKHIRSKYSDYFGITVAGYPEGHPDVIQSDGLATPEACRNDLAYLKRKVDAGADLIVTRFDLAVASGLICGDGVWTLPSSILALVGVKPPICMTFVKGTN